MTPEEYIEYIKEPCLEFTSNDMEQMRDLIKHARARLLFDYEEGGETPEAKVRIVSALSHLQLAINELTLADYAQTRALAEMR